MYDNVNYLTSYFFAFFLQKFSLTEIRALNLLIDIANLDTEFAASATLEKQ